MSRASYSSLKVNYIISSYFLTIVNRVNSLLKGLHFDISFLHHLCASSSREQPIFSARAHVFQIDPTTKRNWIPASKHAVTVSFFYDANRNVYRIISVGGTKVRRVG